MKGRVTSQAEQGFCIEDLPGVGPSLAGRLRAAYGSDAAFQEACRTLDLDRLLQVEGLSERRAFELAAHCRRASEQDVAATERVRQVRRELEDLLAGYANTDPGRRALRLLPIYRDPQEIRKQQDRVQAARDLAERVDRSAVANALGRIRALREAPRPSGLNRIVVVETEDDEMALRARGFDRWYRIIASPKPHDVEGADLVLYAASEGRLRMEEAPNVVEIPLEDPAWSFLPELELQFVHANRATLAALTELAQLTNRSSAAPRILEAAPETTSVNARDIDRAVQQALLEAQSRFQSNVESLSLNGTQILQLLSKGMPAALQEARADAVAAGQAMLKERLGLVFDPFAPGLPLEIDEEETSRVRDEIQSRSARSAFERDQAAARVIQQSRPALLQELAWAFQFDAEFALGCYASDFDAHPAASSQRLKFRQALHVRLAHRPEAQRIDYEVGDAHPVTVLTGANSGGKSTLLELAAQLVILHHWGLPVPAAEAEIPLVDELLYFTSIRGADAGALETFLRELFPPLTRPGRRLVLLDEVESLTELEAAGRILGVFLDEVSRSRSLCILVTHLPDEVLRHTKARVRIDGIDAVGLDESFNLLVDRQPKFNHRARSTPELILRRVHARADGPVRELFARILDRWDAQPQK